MAARRRGSTMVAGPDYARAGPRGTNRTHATTAPDLVLWRGGFLSRPATGRHGPRGSGPTAARGARAARRPSRREAAVIPQGARPVPRHGRTAPLRLAHGQRCQVSRHPPGTTPPRGPGHHDEQPNPPTNRRRTARRHGRHCARPARHRNRLVADALLGLIPRSQLADRGPLNAWQQLNVAFPDWNGAESLAVASIIPLLAEAEADGQVPSWFFIRKQPAWRIRYRLSGTGHPTETTIWRRLDDLAASGCISGWNHGVYEPEVHAFGGDEAMRAAHRFFHGDSNGCLAYLASERATRQPDRRRELSLLLCARMLRAAGLDWYEQGDVWARVAAHRDPPASATAA